MQTFKYKVVTNTGQTKEGSIEATSLESAKKKLAETSEFLIEVKHEKNEIGSFNKFFKKAIKQEDVLSFTRQFKTLIQSGIPLVEAIKAIRINLEHPELKEVVYSIEQKISSGKSLSDALADYPKVFNESFVAMVKAGEATGKLPSILDDLMDFLKWDKNLRKKIRGAVQYPLIVIVAAIIALGFIITFVVPKFAGFFTGGKELPIITRALLAINAWIINYWWTSIFIVGAFFLFRRWIRTNPSAQLRLDGYIFKVPLFGALYKKYIVARFSKIFALLYTSGVTVTESLEIAEKLFANMAYKSECARIIFDVTNGVKLSASVQNSDFFQRLPKQLIEIGERSDNVPEMLLEVGNFYSDELEYTVENAFAIIQPILVVIIGALVCIIALGMFMPMWDAMNIL